MILTRAVLKKYIFVTRKRHSAFGTVGKVILYKRLILNYEVFLPPLTVHHTKNFIAILIKNWGNIFMSVNKTILKK